MHDFTIELNTMNGNIDEFTSKMPYEISDKIRKATSHLRDNRNPDQGANVDNLLIEAQ